MTQKSEKSDRAVTETKESRLTEQVARLESEKERLAENLYRSQMSELDALRKLEAAREAIGQMQGVGQNAVEEQGMSDGSG